MFSPRSAAVSSVAPRLRVRRDGVAVAEAVSRSPGAPDSLAALSDAVLASHRDTGSLARALSQLIDDEITERLVGDDLVGLFECAEHREGGLSEARRGRLASARNQFDAARAVLCGARLSADATLLGTAMLLPAEAYLAYKRELYADARELLFRASALDQVLVRDCGVVAMAAHRVHITHNLLRLECRQGRWEQAVQLAAACLDYLEFADDCLPETLACPPSDLAAVPSQLIELFFNAIVGEIAALFSEEGDSRAVALFEAFEHHALCRGDFAASAHAWLKLKSRSLAGRVTGAAVAALEPMRKPTGAAGPDRAVADLAYGRTACVPK